MFSKILIANRGEIALRVVEACREMEIATVAVHSTADRESLHVLHADENVCIGPPMLKDSYLDISSLIAATEITGADAVHPGYGLLAENPHFAEIVEDCGLGWIGPRPETIRLMGDKAKARETARAAGAPVLPGSEGPLESPGAARDTANEVGFPVILKATAGGGGRGMRVVSTADDLEIQYLSAQSEASAAFGDDTLYLEKYLPAPRHVEVQVLGDRVGSLIHLGERECSIQRRHQKLLEESPAIGLTAELRGRLTSSALAVATAVGYENAGTVEFLLDGDDYYFLEMNTRIQVEHPVTEIVTAVDLVKEQIRIASGELLGPLQSREPRGHAIECRINAEHPRTFAPSPGRLTTFQVPGGPGVRIDTHAYAGYLFPPFYDSLLAKVIAFGADRPEAVDRMRRALDLFVIEGVETTLPLHRAILRDPEFLAGRLSTAFLERFLKNH